MKRSAWAFIFGERGYVHQCVMPRSSRRCWKCPRNSEPLFGEHEAWGGRQEMTQGIQGEGRLAARRGGGGKGDGEAGGGVDEGEHVAAEAGLEAHHGIAGEHLEWPMPEALGWAGFAGPGHGFVGAHEHPSGQGRAASCRAPGR